MQVKNTIGKNQCCFTLLIPHQTHNILRCDQFLKSNKSTVVKKWWKNRSRKIGLLWLGGGVNWIYTTDMACMISIFIFSRKPLINLLDQVPTNIILSSMNIMFILLNRIFPCDRFVVRVCIHLMYINLHPMFEQISLDVCSI